MHLFLHRLLLFFSILYMPQIANASSAGHTQAGSHYEDGATKAYASHRHGPDGALFLDPYFIPHLMHLEGQTVLDAGCGAAPWAILAAQNGAHVFGIDIQPKMISLARLAVQLEKIEDRVFLVVGDVASLPYSSQVFDHAISINVGCNLPCTTRLFNQDGQKQLVGLEPHVREMARTLKAGGTAIVTAPASFGIVFTNGTDKEAVSAHIQEVLSKIGNAQESAIIVAHLNELTEVYRATFAMREGRLTLITDENELFPGEEIWRKLPALTVPNRYHGESEYRQAFSDASLAVIETHRPHFSHREEQQQYNLTHPDAQMGEEYVSDHPFVIFCLKKGE
jgi:SAM-dependent methyltransferase